MGLMTKLFGGSPNSSLSKGNSEGGHNIDRNRVLGNTTPEVFSPDQPGQLDAMRSVPVVPNPRYFTPEEATALGQLSRKKQSEAKASKRAYKHLRRIEESDAGVTKDHYRYARKVASQEVEKLDAKNKYARRLHGLRPQYAQMGQDYDAATKKADDAIAQIKQGF
jgi:hypothetical protein